jgi:hypothetical protein
MIVINRLTKINVDIRLITNLNITSIKPPRFLVQSIFSIINNGLLYNIPYTLSYNNNSIVSSLRKLKIATKCKNSTINDKCTHTRVDPAII